MPGNMGFSGITLLLVPGTQQSLNKCLLVWEGEQAEYERPLAPLLSNLRVTPGISKAIQDFPGQTMKVLLWMMYKGWRMQAVSETELEILIHPVYSKCIIEGTQGRMGEPRNN